MRAPMRVSAKSTRTGNGRHKVVSTTMGRVIGGDCLVFMLHPFSPFWSWNLTLLKGRLVDCSHGIPMSLVDWASARLQFRRASRSARRTSLSPEIMVAAEISTPI